MIRLFLSLLLFLALSISQAQSLPIAIAQEERDKTASSASKAEVKVTIEKARATYSEVLRELHERFGLNIISDAYPGEAESPVALYVKDATLSDVMQTVANRFQRKIVLNRGVYVMRHVNWAGLANELDNMKAVTPNLPQWKGANSAKVIRHDVPEDIEFPTPARDVSINASEVSLPLLISEFSQKTGWSVVVGDKATRARRVTAYLSHSSPSIVLEEIGFLLNAGPQVTFQPTKLQTVLEKEGYELLPDAMRKRMRLSDKLRTELEKLLTDRDKETIKNGEHVELTVANLPVALQGKVLAYLQEAARLRGDLIPELDMSRAQTFAVRFMPASAGSGWRQLSAVVVGKDGVRYHF